jgi:erythromycin esterase-like protein
MADCLAHAVRRERGRGRVLVYAHNRHLQKGPATWQLGPTLLTWWPAGAHLHQRFGTAYAVIGSSVGVSPDNGIGAPEPGSLEARLGRGQAQGLFIPTRGGRGLSAAEIQALPTRTGSARNPMYMPWNADSFTDFDALAYLPTTTYARGAPALP